MVELIILLFLVTPVVETALALVIAFAGGYDDIAVGYEDAGVRLLVVGSNLIR